MTAITLSHCTLGALHGLLCPDTVGEVTASASGPRRPALPETLTGTNDPLERNGRTRTSANDISGTARVWAPAAGRVELLLRIGIAGAEREYLVEMVPETGGRGWWCTPPGTDPRLLDDLPPDGRYGYLIDRVGPHPDPRAPRLPEGVHGLAAPYRTTPARERDQKWAGVELSGRVLYELHIGTFTPEGTFDAAISRLSHLVDLGVDAVEVMPVNAFNGTHGWGYDGVGWFAVHEPYGGPDAFIRFIDACHARGLGVILDVVHNHLGPSGNFAPVFGPYLSETTNTWGASINLDGPDSDEVRTLIVDNVVRWYTDFGVDGLRLDAVHALADHRAVHILEELATTTEALSAELGRPLALIAESDLNDPRLIVTRNHGGFGLSAQWADDVHHAVHTTISGERQGYYADFGSFAALSKVLRGGFFHDGTYSSFRHRRHGRPIPTDLVGPSSLVVFSCNHDQVGNRATGDRPSEYLDHGLLGIKAALILLSPFTPMLFMGEEWAASTPFRFFTSHPEPELGLATAQGRKAEFAEHGWDRDDIPDPQDPDTFTRSRLDWAEPGREPHRRILRLYTELIALRRRSPDLSEGGFDSVTTEYDEQAGWFVMHRPAVSLGFNLGDRPQRLPLNAAVILSWGEHTSDGDGIVVDPHALVVTDRSPTNAT